MSGIKDLARKLFSGGDSGRGSAEEATDPERGAETGRTLNVQGMTCGHCEAAVERELNNLEGVRRADADSGKDTVEVDYDDSEVSDDDLKNAVEEAGYTLAA